MIRSGSTGSLEVPPTRAFGSLSSPLVLRTLVVVASLVLLVLIVVVEPGVRLGVLAAAGTGALAGLTASAVGVFGGVLVPLLLLQGIDPRAAATLSLLLQVAIIPLGAHSHYAVGNVRGSIVRPLTIAGMIGSSAGALASGLLSHDLAGRAVAIGIVLTGIFVLIDASRARSDAPVRPVGAFRIGSIGLVAGVASGISGAGWGPIGVKLLILSRVTPRLAIGSSLVARSFMAIAALATYALASPIFDLRLRPEIVAAVAAGSIIGIVPGAGVTTRLNGRTAARVIAVLSIALVLPTLLQGLR